MTAITVKSVRPIVGILLLALFIACSQDSKDNPLNPALTSPVELQVTVDDTTGTTALTWTPYEGEAFAAYWVLRDLRAADLVDTLTIITDLSRTVYVDSTALTGLIYSYRISAINADGLEVPSTPESVRSLDHPDVEILSLDVDSPTASATVNWSAYTGSRFKAYRLLRRTDGAAPVMVAETTDITSTSAVDDDLTGNTEYQYQVVVLTDLDEEIASEERSGLLHPLIDTWALDMEEGEYVRLYKQGGAIMALMTGEQRVRLLSFASDGQLLEEQVLLEHPWLEIAPHTGTITFLPDGTRLLGLVTAPFAGYDGWSPQLLAFDADGLLLSSEIDVDHDFQSAGSSTIEVEGQIFLLSSDAQTLVDNVKLTSNGRVLFDDEFDRSDLGEWESLGGLNEIEDGALRLGGAVRRKVTASWHDIRLEADVTGVAALIAKADTMPLGIHPHAMSVSDHTSLLVSLTYGETTPVTRLMFLPPPESGLSHESFQSPLLQTSGLTLHPSIEINAGMVSASVESPTWWPSKTKQLLRGILEPVSLILVGESVAFTVGDSLNRITSRGSDVTFAIDHSVSEIRLRETASEQQLGICVPDQHQILIAPTQVSRIGYIDWPFFADNTAIVVGSEAGTGPGALFYPLSFDVGSDGRIYVLDAGNKRIQAFDSDGTYVTQWGNGGTADGQFDFGNGYRPQDFAGSIAVDDDGFVYVADVGNRRIQVFAP
jgi:hypothetical protein